VSSASSRRIFFAVVIIGVSAYAALIVRNISFNVGGADSSGYLGEAKMFAEGRLRIPIDPLRELAIGPKFAPVFTPLGFSWTSTDHMVPLYPPGLPLHFAAAGIVFGWDRAPFYVSPIFTLLTIAAIYFLAREAGLDRWFSIGAAAIFAAIPVVISTSLQPLSDNVATFWAVLAILFAYRRWPVPAGVAFAIGVWVRPTNLLLALPLAFALRWQWRSLLLAAAGALPLGRALMWMNFRMFGSPFTTGYGRVTDVVDWNVLRTCSMHHLGWIAKTLTPLVPVATLLAVFDRKISRWTRVTLFAWFVVFIAFYSVYNVCQDWWDMRFVLPGIPAAIIATVLVLQRFPKAIAALLMVALVMAPAMMSRRLSATGFGRAESFWPATIAWAEPQLPKRAVVISGIYSGPFYYYAKRFTARHDMMDSDTYQLLRAYAGVANLPWYAMISADADLKPDQFLAKYPGNWTKIDQYRDCTLWRLDE
jgi:hypothetical protein